MHCVLILKVTAFINFRLVVPVSVDADSSLILTLAMLFQYIQRGLYVYNSCQITLSFMLDNDLDQ